MTTAASMVPQPSTGSMSRRVRYLWWGIALALTVAILAAATTLPWAETLAAIIEADAAWLAAALLANIAIFPLWALEWRLLTPKARRAPLKCYYEITALYSSAKTIVPATGLPSALALLIAVGGLPFGVAVSVLALDQLVTGIAKLLLLILAVSIVPLPLWLRGGALSLLSMVAVGLIVLATIAHAGEGLNRLASRRSGLFANLVQRLGGWAGHLELLRSRSRIGRVLALSVGKKLVEVAAALAVQKAAGIPISVEAAILVVAALSIAVMIPAAPGNLGVYEATVLLVYQSMGVSAPTALAAALLQHAAALLPGIGVGGVVALMRHRRADRAGS